MVEAREYFKTTIVPTSNVSSMEELDALLSVNIVNPFEIELARHRYLKDWAMSYNVSFVTCQLPKR